MTVIMEMMGDGDMGDDSVGWRIKGLRGLRRVLGGGWQGSKDVCGGSSSVSTKEY
jgi:hypothetical protein